MNIVFMNKNFNEHKIYRINEDICFIDSYFLQSFNSSNKFTACSNSTFHNYFKNTQKLIPVKLFNNYLFKSLFNNNYIYL